MLFLLLTALSLNVLVLAANVLPERVIRPRAGLWATILLVLWASILMAWVIS